MIFKELNEHHFKNKKSMKILLTDHADYNNSFYDHIYVLTDYNTIKDILYEVDQASFLFIDIRTLKSNFLIEILIILKEILFSKVFLVFASPKLPLMKRRDIRGVSTVQSDKFKGKGRLVIIANTIFFDLEKWLAKYSYDEISFYLPFPSYFPFEREYIINSMFNHIEISDNNDIPIMYFDSTNPYDIFYKLNRIKDSNNDYLIICDNLISAGAISCFIKNEMEYSIIQSNEFQNEFHEQAKFYEISDLL